MIFITSENELNINDGLSILYFYSTQFLFNKRTLLFLYDLEKSFKDINF